LLFWKVLCLPAALVVVYPVGLNHINEFSFGHVLVLGQVWQGLRWKFGATLITQN